VITTAQIEHDRRVLRAALLDHAFRPGEGWRKNGRPFGWMIDCREVLLASAVLPALSRLMYGLIADWYPRAVVGTGLAGAPLVAAIALESARNAKPIDGLLLRDRPKAYGRRRQLEGPIPPPGSRVVIVDDVLSSGATAQWAARALAQHTLQPAGVATLMTFEGSVAKPLISDNLPRRALFTLADLGIVAADDDAATAEVLWQLGGLNHDDDVPFSRPTRCGELVVAGSNRGEVLAVDLAGALRWRVAVGDTETPAPPTHCSPLPTPHGIVIGTDEGVLHCLDPVTGRRHWSARCGDRIGSGLVGDENSHVYITATDLPRSGALVCVDATNGTLQWRRPLTGYAHARPGLAADGRTVVAADNAGMISAFAADGTPRWRRGLSAAVKADLTIDDRGTCYCVDFDGFLTALDLADGRVLWRRKLGRRLYSTPLVTMTDVIVGGDEHAFCLERRSGKVTWVAPIGRRARGAISRLADGTLAFGCRDGTVRFVSDGGLNRGMFRTGGAVTSGATSLDDRSILVSSADGHVYALRSPHPP